MKSKTVEDMKHRNLILEKKIKRNINEMKLLVKIYEMTWLGRQWRTMSLQKM